MVRSGVSIFDTLTKIERDRTQDAYLEYVKGRDGVPDLAARSLKKREAYFAKVEAEAAKYQGDVPTAEFFAGMKSNRELKQMSELGQWMCCVARSNEGESFVIDMALADSDKRSRDLNDPITYVQLEEFYHTRMLLHSLDLLGVSDLRLSEPRGFGRTFLTLLARMPKDVSNVLALLGEVAGVVLFDALRDKGAELLDADDPVTAQILDMLDQLLIDEYGHMAFVRSRLGPVRMELVRKMAPKFIPRMYLDNRPAAALFSLRELTERALAMDLDFPPERIQARVFDAKAVMAPN